MYLFIHYQYFNVENRMLAATGFSDQKTTFLQLFNINYTTCKLLKINELNLITLCFPWFSGGTKVI